MSYHCCNCTNTLKPQGPILANFVTPGQEIDNHQTFVHLNQELRITNLASIASNLSDRMLSRPMNIEFTEPLEGMIKNFRVQNYTLHFSRVDIVICCENCGKCCSYII